MNFHKKIGFLAALLLMIGLGAPDSFAQNTISVQLTIPDGGVVEEVKTDVTVTLTLIPLPVDGTTVAVKVVAALLDGSEIGSTTINVVGEDNGIVQDSNIGSIDVRPPRDADADNETVQVTATAAGYASGSAAMVITDDELTIEVTVTPDGGATGFREGTTVTAGVTGAVSEFRWCSLRILDSDATPVTVSVSFAPAEFTKVLDPNSTPDAAVPLPLKIEIPAGQSSNTLTNYQFVVKDNTKSMRGRY